MFADDQWSQVFPPVLTVEAAAGLAGVPIATIYDWSSRGLLFSSDGEALRSVCSIW